MAVLPQQNHVECLKRLAPCLTEREMIAGLIAHGEQLNRGDQFLAAQREFVRRVIGQAVAAFLRLQQQREGRIPRMLMRSMGSIWTATFNFMGWPASWFCWKVKCSGAGVERR